jgi:hypothetical protein
LPLIGNFLRCFENPCPLVPHLNRNSFHLRVYVGELIASRGNDKDATGRRLQQS